MPSIEFDIVVVTQTLEEDRHLAEVLLFPDICSYGDKLSHVHNLLRKRAQKTIEESLPLDLHRRLLPSPPSLREVTVLVKPPLRSPIWKEPVELRFHTVQWRHGDRPYIVYVPALGIETIVSREEELGQQLESDIRFALVRKEIVASLQGLLQLSRYREMRTDTLSLHTMIQTPKQRATAGVDKPISKPRLSEVATDMIQQRRPPAFDLEDVLLLMADALTGPKACSVLLVGPSGVGKTAAVYELVRQRRELGVPATQFWATSGARLVSGMSGFGMWQQRCAELCREVVGQQTILYLGNLVELMEVGKYEGNTQGVGRFLAPHIACGEIVALAECTREQVSTIEQEAPQLLGAFTQIQLDPPDQTRCRRILRNCANAQVQAGHAAISDEALDELDRLHRRYATYSAEPGRAIQFLDRLLLDHREDGVVQPHHVTKAFSRGTGLPDFLLDDSMTLDLENTRQWFHERIVGQPEAIDVIVDLLAVVKQRLNRPGRPIASLLFIGPTGVGKTEMAKTLAQFLFGQRSRMIRFDMSEYADPVSVAELIGGQVGSEGLLTAKVREQPFSVLLLDEFEKAHPAFFDLLLQVLGEGRLTDASGRLANFCNCVVIMTSNLGAASFQKGPMGFMKSRTLAKEAKEHFVEEVRSHLRPELFNRIDRIVPFEPLSFQTVSRIAARELQKIHHRDGILLRSIDLDIPGAVVKYLVGKGYDPLYGARPLQRAIEREFLVPLADGINRYSMDQALRVDVRVEDGHLTVRVRARDSIEAAPDTGKTRLNLEAAADARIAGVLGIYSRKHMTAKSTGLRRDIQRLERGSAVQDLRNNLNALERIKTRWERAGHPGRRPNWEEHDHLEALPRLQHCACLLDDIHEKALALEDRELMAIYHSETPVPPVSDKELSGARDRFERLLLALYALQFAHPDYVTLAIFGEDTASVMTLTRLYYSIACELHFEVRIGQFHPPRKARAQGGVIGHSQVVSVDRFLEEPPEKLLGVSLALAGPMAYCYFELERGVHAFVGHQSEHYCLVEASDLAIEQYVPPAGIERAGAVRAHNIRRSYDMQKRMVKDEALDWRWHQASKGLVHTISVIVRGTLQEKSFQMCGAG